jgi:YVTN family beta-propeller protein
MAIKFMVFNGLSPIFSTHRGLVAEGRSVYNESFVITRRRAIAACMSAAAGCGRRTASGFDGYAFVANEEGQAVAVVNLASFTLVRHIPLAAAPSVLISHNERKTVFALTPETGAIHEIVASRPTVQHKINVADRAISMRLDPDNRALWVLCGQPAQLVRVPLDTLRPEARIPLPLEPVDFDLSASGNLCAVSYGEQGSVTMFPINGRRAGRSVPIGGIAGVARFRYDGRQLIAANVAGKVISILETPTGRVVTHLPLAIQPERFCFKADGGQLFVTGAGMDAVVIVYPYWTEVDATLLAGRAPGVMAVSAPPSPEYLFVANPQSGDVTVLDIETRRVIAVVTVGGEPGHIAVTPDSQYALVLSRRSGNMAVIRIADIVPRRTRSAPLLAVIPVGSRPVSAAVLGV